MAFTFKALFDTPFSSRDFDNLHSIYYYTNFAKYLTNKFKKKYIYLFIYFPYSFL